jgi:spore coat polysaccharide biosynthesis protein SpsF
MKTIVIIQARMGSTRLPGKVSQDLAGEPMLARVVNRTRRAQTIDDIVIATTTLSPDDVLDQLCLARGWICYRGSENDVLDRYYQAARKFGADVIVRITSDCPLIDPDVIDQVVRAFQTEPCVDYASNILPLRTFPRGLDTEVFRFELLERLWHQDQNPVTREHVTQYIYKHLDEFSTRGVTHSKDLSPLRWTVDTPEDLAFTRKIYEHFSNAVFSWQDVLTLLAEHPDWQSLNAHIEQKVI